MDIDDFLDREISDLGLQTDKTGKQDNLDLPQKEVPQVETSPIFENIRSNLGKGNLDEAEQAYVQLWHLLTQQKLKWNQEVYDQLQVLSRQFSSALSYAYEDVKKKAGSIYEMISRARAAIREGKKDLPFKLYAEIENISNSIPDVFFEEKKIINEQIMGFYSELRNSTDNDLAKRVLILVQDINKLIDKINLAIKSNDMVNAIVNYNRCIGQYNQIPEGFLRHKNPIGIRILEIYKTLSIYNEIDVLQKQLSERPSPTTSRQQVFSNAQAPIQYSKTAMLTAKKERAKRNIEKGFYNEASKEIQEAMQIDPNDAEAKSMHERLKAMQQVS